MSYPFGIDISSWQSYPDRQLWMDISALTRHPEPVQFVFCRATHGMYADKAHAYYTRELDRFGIPNGSYAYMLPANSARLQTDLFLQIAPPKEHRRHVIDMEAAQGLSRTRITDFLLEVLEIMRERTGRYPMVYSRALWIRDHLQVSRLPKLDYWLAQYLTRRPAPQYTPEFPTDKISIPAGVDRKQVKFHQSGDKANGGKLGSMSYYIDTDRFLGTPEQLRAWFGYGEIKPDPEPDDPPVEVEKPLYDVRIASWATPYVNLRSEPRIAKETDIGDAYPNEVLSVIERQVVAGQHWLRSTKGWLMERFTERMVGSVPGMLAVRPLLQIDPRWRNSYLGTSRSTIGGWGCLLTSATMTANYLMGTNYTPDQMNAILVAVNGFVRYYTVNGVTKISYQNANLYRFASLWEAFPDRIKAGVYVDCEKVPAPLHVIDGELDKDRPVIVKVDYKPLTAYVDEHWITIIGKDAAGQYHIADPLHEGISLFNLRYGDPARYIFRIVSYGKI